MSFDQKVTNDAMATTDNGNRERAIFEAALDIASADGRLGYLQGACGEDAALLARVQALLRAHEAPEGFLPERPRDGATVSLVTEKPGDKIGHYKLLEQIGEGGCGVVYMAEQTSRSGAGWPSRSSSWAWTPNTSSPGSRPSARPWR